MDESLQAEDKDMIKHSWYQATDKEGHPTLPLHPCLVMTYHFLSLAKKLGFCFNETLPMAAHIEHLCRTLFCQLYRAGTFALSSILILQTNLLFLIHCPDQITVNFFWQVILTTNWINFRAYKIMKPDLSSVRPGM